jgi:hypothetical protein
MAERSAQSNRQESLQMEFLLRTKLRARAFHGMALNPVKRGAVPYLMTPDV